MSLLTTEINQEPAVEVKKQQVAERLIKSAAANYQHLKSLQKSAIDTVWHNPRGLSPQDVCDALGEKAVKLFDLHGALTDCIIQLAEIDGIEADVALPTNAFERNEDGTITILDTPYVAE